MRAAGGCSSAQGSASGSVRVERAGERGAAASSAGKGSGAEEGWLRASGLAGQASTPAPLCSLPLSKPQLRLPQSGVLRSALWQTRKTLCVRFLLVTEFVVAVTPRKPTQGSRPTRHTQRAPLRMTLIFDPWPAAHNACVFSAGSIAGCLFEKGYVGLVCRPRPRFPGSRGGEGHVRVYRGARSGVPLILPQAWRTDPPSVPAGKRGFRARAHPRSRPGALWVQRVPRALLGQHPGCCDVCGVARCGRAPVPRCPRQRGDPAEEVTKVPQVSALPCSVSSAEEPGPQGPPAAALTGAVPRAGGSGAFVYMSPVSTVP